MAQQATIQLESEEAQKLKFAAALAYSLNCPLKAAQAVFPTDPSRAMFATSYWTGDPIVIQEVKRLIAEYGADEFAATEDELAVEIYTLLQTWRDPEMKLKAYRLYGELRGFLGQKGGTANTTNNTVINQNRVMVVERRPDNPVEFYDAVEERQRRLIANA